ncbi:MAG: TIGR03960 family B12-binding radical SAM protein [Deltaproteobacteria bacterium]|nr:TIGR03960 family B12-binding radical SAM protein [Deltaproteobacteria bacterium]MBW2075566.1 TIGR03960 family B12-binding radical SAM protein [Deltaproteobacteria bacterium]RLB80247.1 MAG: TIGR03960 family B12-binding radical SAM protein [Deltaproteobacteria bacterium]
MPRQSLEEILPLVQRPSHYLGTEINACRKDSEKIQLRFALAFPDLYEVGMSHMGIQILYHILNARQAIAAERVFAPGVDLEARLRASQTPLCSLESGTPLSAFDIVGFSLLYELNFTNILTILDLSGIPFYARDRDGSHPFVIAGGPCTFNPEPLADFFDAMVVGDGEGIILELADAWLAWKGSGADREALLKVWSRLQGVYVPSFFRTDINAKGLQVITPRFPAHRHVRKALVSDLNQAPFPDSPVVPFGKPIHDRLSLEVCRGCTRGCRFCQAGMIYRPVRERAPHEVLSLAEQALAATGYEEVSLLSLSTGDYSAIQDLVERLMSRCEPEKIAVSLPSLRVGSLTESLMAQIKRVRKTGFTVAPEAGSERLRRVINKNVTERDLEETVRSALGLGWQLIKLYFMIGLPTETEADLDAIVELVRRLQKIRVSGGHNINLNVSVSTFIPKAHTPFQWCAQMPVEEGKEKIRILRSKLKGRGLRLKWQYPEMSLLEGLWARGDRRLSPLLVKAHEMGCRLDGWSDHFQYKRWQAAIEACGVDVDFYTARQRDLSEPLPWDHIDSGVSKDFQRGEWEKAVQESETLDCRKGECNLCGVCDLETIKPMTFQAEANLKVGYCPASRPQKPVYRKLQVSYAKRGQARYFGHLELVKIFIRAFRRARIPLRFTEGFHPAPKVSFESALPVGTESLEERFIVEVPLHVAPGTLFERVNQELPEGLTITACNHVHQESQGLAPKFAHYRVTLKHGTFHEANLRNFLGKKAWPLTKTNRKGRSKSIDLKPLVKKLRLVSPRTAEMTLEVQAGHSVRPTDVLGHIFGLSEETLKLATIIKG